MFKGVLGVHVGDLVGGGNLTFSIKLRSGFGLSLSLVRGIRVNLDLVVER